MNFLSKTDVGVEYAGTTCRREIRNIFAASPGAAVHYVANLCPEEPDAGNVICEVTENNLSAPIRQRLPAARTTAVLESLVEQPTGVPFHLFSRDPTDAAFLLSTRSGRPIVYLRPVPIVPLRASASLMPLSLHVRQILAGNHEAPDKHGEPRLSIYVYLGC
jgi:hypothetical protein